MNHELVWVWRHELTPDEGFAAGSARLWRSSRPSGKIARGWAVWEPPRDIALGDEEVFARTGACLSAWIDSIEPSWMWVVLHDGARVASVSGSYADPSGGGGFWLYAGGAGASLEVVSADVTTKVQWGATLVVGVSARGGAPVDAVEGRVRDAVEGVVSAWAEGRIDALGGAVAALVACRREADGMWRGAEGLARAGLGARLLAADTALARLSPWILPWLPPLDPDAPADAGRGWWTGDGFPTFGPVGEAP